MTLWEFSNSNFAFKESCIKSIPSKYCSRSPYIHGILATSSDKYLIIACEFEKQLIYNGRDWKLRKVKPSRRRSLSGHYCNMAAIVCDSHAVFVIESHEWSNVVNIRRALIPSLDGSKDEDMATTYYWETLEMISLEEFDALLRTHGRGYSIIVQNQQFYCVGSQGIIFTAFLQPPILPVVWGNSGVNFDQAPRLVGLPDGALLMIGTIRHQDRPQLDVIKISQKGNHNLLWLYKCSNLSIVL